MSLYSIQATIVAGITLLLAGCSLDPPHPQTREHSNPQYSRYDATVRSEQPLPQSSPHHAVTIAEQMLGKPYRYGGNTPQGFDCSGLVYYSYSKAGYSVPRDSRGQYAATTPVDPRDLRPGDLLFFDIDGKSDHVAIYVGSDRFIHAPSGGKQVSYASLSNDYWRNRFLRAGRIE